MLIFLRICIKYSQHSEMRKNNSKLNFTKNRHASLFSRGRLKISKWSISLARLGYTTGIFIKSIQTFNFMKPNVIWKLTYKVQYISQINEALIMFFRNSKILVSSIVNNIERTIQKYNTVQKGNTIIRVKC